MGTVWLPATNQPTKAVVHSRFNGYSMAVTSARENLNIVNGVAPSIDTSISEYKLDRHFRKYVRANDQKTVFDTTLTGSSKPLTVFAEGTLNSVTGTNMLACVKDTSTSGGTAWAGIATRDNKLIAAILDGGNYREFISSTTYSVGDLVKAVAVFNLDRTFLLFVNGVQVASLNPSYTGNVTFSIFNTCYLTVGGGIGSGDAGDVSISMAGAFKGVPDAELISNVWSAFEVQDTKYAMVPEYVACTKQPQGAVEIDYGDSITRGLLSSMVASLDTDVVRKTRLTSRSGKPEPTQLGMASPTSTSQGFSASSENIAVNRLFDEITLVAVVVGQLSANPTSSTFTHCGGHETAIVQTGYAINGISAKAYYHPTYTGTFALNSPVNTLLANGQMQVIVFRYRRNGLCELFVNNVVVASGTSANNAVKFDHPFGLGFNQITKGSGLSAAAGTLANAIYGRALTDAEIASISSNPWQLFRQKVSVPLDVTVKENRKPVIRESNLLGTSKRKLSETNVSGIREPHSKQPQSFAQLDRSNRITDEISWFVLPNIGSRKFPKVSCTVSPIGMVSQSSAIGVPNRGDEYSTTQPFHTILHFGLYSTTGATRQLAGVYQSSLLAGTCWVQRGSNGVTLGFANSSNSYTETPAVAVPNSTSGIPSVIMVRTTASVIDFFIQGIKTGTHNVVSLTNASTFSGMNATYGGAPESPCSLVVYWNRALSDAEISSVSSNPWQLFKNQSQLILPK